MKPASILVVEDDVIVAMDIQQRLCLMGYTVADMVTVPEQALKCVKETHPDLVLMDIRLGGGTDGIDVAADIRRLYSIPVVFLTAYSENDTLERAKLAEPFGYILKPFDDRDLNNCIEMALYKHKTEVKLLETQSLLLSIAEGASDAIYVKDRAGRYLMMNTAGLSLAGKTLEQVIGRDDTAIHSADYVAAIQLSEQQIMEGGKTVTCEETYTVADGSTRTCLSTKGPVRNAEGCVTGVFSVTHDITERKRIETQLEEANDRLQALFQASPLPMLLHDHNGWVILWNPAAEVMFGWKTSEVIGMPPPFVPDNRKSEFYANVQRVFSSETLHGIEMQLQTKSGVFLDVMLSAAPLHNQQGKITGAVSIVADLTEKKQLEAKFLRSQRLESIGTLASGIAHDLNNILAPILMSAPLLRQSIEDPELRSVLDTIESSARRGAEVVKQVLTFSRGIQGERVPVQLRYLIKETGKIIQETFPKSISFHSRIADNLWMVIGDITQLHQVLMNLCVNARDAMTSSGSLTIQAENVILEHSPESTVGDVKPGPHVRLSVIDTGVGIPPEILERIFEPFFTTKALDKGTGLGLSTVLGIVKSHGGAIHVTSALGKGSQFTIYLPAVTNASSALPELDPDFISKGTGQWILVVDDEEHMRKIIQSTLQASGYRCLEAADGTVAVPLYDKRRKDIQLVITDLMMPNLDGPTTIEILRKINPQLKIIAITGLGSHPMIHDASQLKVQAFLKKPFNANLLLQTVQDVLAGADQIA